MPKKVVRCKKCENRVPIHQIGFIQDDKLHCVQFDIPVDKDDGCTFGNEGDPTHKMVQNIEVDISDHVTVYGFDEWEDDE